MDYANRSRIKLWGEASVVEGDEELMEQLKDETYKARPERVMLITVKAWDINCPQHITPRFTQEVIEPVIKKLQDRIAELEALLEGKK
jgi:predicted pyridoxine 5'-phosphate oxidase superfamily flavin-nucleotide-binding protein